MPFRFNPFTDKLDLVETSISPTGDIAFLSGNTGGQIPPDVAGNVNIIGSGSITVSGNIPTNTLTISSSLSSPGVVLIETKTANSGQWLTFTSISSTYSDYLVIVSNAYPAAPSTDNSSLHMELSTDGGSTFLTTGYVASATAIYSDTALAGFPSTDDWPLGAGQLNGTPANFTIWFSNLNNGLLPTYRANGASTVSDTNHPGVGTQAAGGYTTNVNVNAFRIGFNTGDIANISVSLYGIVT